MNGTTFATRWTGDLGTGRPHLLHQLLQGSDKTMVCAELV
ncbi:hypothetical protein ABIB15_002603 [Marisediminicola sp. UYEF4]